MYYFLGSESKDKSKKGLGRIQTPLGSKVLAFTFEKYALNYLRERNVAQHFYVIDETKINEYGYDKNEDVVLLESAQDIVDSINNQYTFRYEDYIINLEF